MGFFVQCNCKSEDFHIVFIVLMFCEAEAINMCREIKLQKKKNYTLKLIRLINLECNVGIRLKPWPVYKAVLRHKE